MARYIDADALIEVLEKYKFGAISNDTEREYIKETVLNFVNEQPTAYNVEAVVAELKKESYQEWCDSPKIVELKDAIDIVRNAGKEVAE
jgi:hypothetical protein